MRCMQCDAMRCDAMRCDAETCRGGRYNCSTDGMGL
jgi:hypothetical protein